jgi:hypothetical protein
MRIFVSMAALLLLLFLLTSGPAFSQQSGPDHPQDEKSRDKDANGQANSGRDESRPTERQPDGREHPEAARPRLPAQPEDRRDAPAGRTQEQTRPEGKARPEERRDDRKAEGNAGRPVQGQRGQRIPEEKFRASFGPEHHFHVKRARIIDQAQPEFVYSGYIFELADPWPTEWSYDDDCYVDYVDDNYYLFDVYHPGIRILVFVIG